MVDLGQIIYDIFGPYGEIGVLVFVAIIFLLDALLIPVLPELFFIVGLEYDPGSLIFGVEVLTAAVIGEMIGVLSLYLVVEKVGIPKRIRNVADKYVKFLIVSDERILLVNRFAPVLPFVGAFISMTENWKLSRAMFYLIVGCVLKYGAIMILMVMFNVYYGGLPTSYVILFILIVIGVSFIASYLRKRNFNEEQEETI